MNVQWSTLNRVVPKETTVCMSSHTVDHCRLQVNSQLSTAKSRWCWELLQHLSQSTVKYWWCNMDVEWFTLENGMLMETTLTCTRTLCGPLGAQDEFTVVYCRMWDGAGSYCGTHHRGQ